MGQRWLQAARFPQLHQALPRLAEAASDLVDASQLLERVSSPLPERVVQTYSLPSSFSLRFTYSVVFALFRSFVLMFAFALFLFWTFVFMFFFVLAVITIDVFITALNWRD